MSTMRSPRELEIRELHELPKALAPPSLSRWRFIVPLGRLLFSLIFLMAVPNHFNPLTIQHAADMGVPLASILVPIAGLMANIGGISILLGYKVRFGAMLLVLFLIPTTLAMHAFWLTGPEMYPMQQAMFMKNLALIGACLLLFWQGAGPVSLDERPPS